MSAEYVTWFWIAWRYTEIYVGTGDVIGQNVLMYANNTYSVPMFPINALIYRSMNKLPCYYTFINETYSQSELY